VMGAIGGMASGIGAAIGAKIKSLGGFLGGGAAGGLHDPTSSGEFTPGAYHPSGGSNVTVHTTTALNVDGKRMAQVVTKHQVAMNTHPRQSPYMDAHADYSPLDYGFSTG
jgi:hypothetical protein